MANATLPTISSYGRYSSDNYGGHTNRLEFGTLTLYYSYKTIVAFSTPETGRVVSENVWSTTTGKHLNWIDGGNKKERIGRDEFVTKLRAALEKYGIDPNEAR
jgi:hypothetical protein